MEILFALFPISILIALVILAAYFWGVRSGQFDDLETPAMRMLFDEEQESPTISKQQNERQD